MLGSLFLPTVVLAVLITVGVHTVACQAAVTVAAHGGAVSAQGGPVTVTLDTSSCTASCLITVCYAASTAGLPGRPISDNMNNSWTEVVGTKQRETDDVVRLTQTSACTESSR